MPNFLSTVSAPSTPSPGCNGKYKADVEWKLNIVLPGWPQLHSELDLKQGQSSFIISSKKKKKVSNIKIFQTGAYLT